MAQYIKLIDLIFKKNFQFLKIVNLISVYISLHLLNSKIYSNLNGSFLIFYFSISALTFRPNSSNNKSCFDANFEASKKRFFASENLEQN